MNKLHYLLLIMVSTIPLSVYTASTSPRFACGGLCIELVAQGSLCGALRVVPISKNPFGGTAELRLRSVLFYQSLVGSTWNSEPIATSGRVPPEGIRVRYDWAGGRPSFHYRIYCQKYTAVGGGQYNIEDVVCQDYVKIEGVKHNVGCVGGPAGPEASYDPLYMNKG